jgi:hypothetical protein
MTWRPSDMELCAFREALEYLERALKALANLQESNPQLRSVRNNLEVSRKVLRQFVGDSPS